MDNKKQTCLTISILDVHVNLPGRADCDERSEWLLKCQKTGV
jgi:hypothetical protein